MWEVTAPAGPGPHNAITDVDGVLVGHCTRIGDGWCTGVTVVLTPDGATAGVDVRGGGPGTRETDLLDPRNLVQAVHAVVLAGGSAYGLDAAGGVMAWLSEHHVGFPVGPERHEVVPIVPAAVLFDLKAGTWGCWPDASFGRAACDAATAGPVAAGSVGAGTGAAAGPVKGGVGTCSIRLDNGITVGALVACNARGHAVDPATGTLYGAPFLLPGELPGLGAPSAEDVAAAAPRLAAQAKMARLNTTIGVVATDATLTKAECAKVAQMAHDGLARALRPVHTLYDGDTLFALATGRRLLDAPAAERYAADASRAALVNDLGAAAADAVARAVVHAVVHATTVGTVAAYRDLFPSAWRT